MPYLITHFFDGGTEEEYHAAVAAAHPPGGLPAGQTWHAAGPTEGGWLVVALWDSKEACDTFMHDTLVPVLQGTEGVLPGPPEERTSELVAVVPA